MVKTFFLEFSKKRWNDVKIKFLDLVSKKAALPYWTVLYFNHHSLFQRDEKEKNKTSK